MSSSDPLLAESAASVLDMFASQVVKQPDATALVGSPWTLTYQQLDERANSVAARLFAAGVRPGDVVATFTGRSVEAIVALLAIWKTGGIYLPLDPAYPAQRLEYIFSDSSARCVLAGRAVADRLPVDCAPVLVMDEGEPGTGQWNAHRTASSDLAYIIYTSGSTGLPKGVCVEHGALALHVRAIQDLWHLGTADRVLEFASLSFDVSLEEILPILCSGGTLILRGDDGWGPAELNERVEEFGITVLDLPTAYWHQWVLWSEREAIRPPPVTLRLVVIGGDAVLPETIQRWRRSGLSGIPLINAYGPTETVITSMAYTVPPTGSEDNGAVAIGTPLSGRTAYVMDEHGQQVSPGREGELWVGGAALARSYLNRPSLTSERFVPGPSIGEPRVYRTGDVARQRPDGVIEFLGRRDTQVKIRGFRVEPGEIETILLGHPAVAEAVVEAQDFGSGDRRLVAYIVSRAETAITGGDVRRYLQARMPDYLVPTYVIPVDALPIMPNGKIDRRALPVPGPNRPDLGHPVLQPQTPIEHILAQVWEEVLKVDEVGIADNFFELGGDSLLSMQMIARARQHGIVLKSEDLIDRPTIAELAASAASGAGVVIADQGTVEGPVPLVPSQLQYLEEDHPVAQWIERTVLELKRPLHSGLLEEALASVLAHHDVLRARFTRAGDQWKQTILAAEERRTFSAFDVRRASELHAHGGMPAVEMEARGEIDITSGPLVRALHLARIHKPSRLILYIHHLVVDAYSIPILVQDLETAYLQLERGQTVRLPPKTTSFRVWSERLLDYAGSDSLRRQIDYWAGIGERARSLPFALSARESSTGHLQYVTARLSSGETETLVRGIPRTRGVQLTDLLLTALALAFRRWAGSEHLIVRLSVHGREAPFDDMDVSRTAGWFATEFPFLLNPGAAADPLDALAAVTEQLRRIPDGGLGYGVLRYLCPDDGPAARLCALPPVSVSLNYQGRPDHLLEESSLFTIRKKANTQPPPDTVPLSYRLPVTAQIHSGQLYLRVRFHDEAYKESDIQSVMSHIVEALRALVHAAPVAAGQ